jgi:hypothetical protein
MSSIIGTITTKTVKTKATTASTASTASSASSASTNATTAAPVFERARLRGSLNAMPLADVVQLLSTNRRTAIIHVATPPGCGVIHVDAGEVSFVRFNADGKRAVSTGSAALARMLACDRGSFDVSFGACAIERNVQGSTSMLLLEAARLLDEQRR